MALKFYTRVAKGLKLKFRKFLGLLPTFVNVKGGRLMGGFFTPILNRVKIALFKIALIHEKKKRC